MWELHPQQLLEGQALKTRKLLHQIGDVGLHRCSKVDVPVVHQTEQHCGGERLGDTAEPHRVTQVGGTCTDLCVTVRGNVGAAFGVPHSDVHRRKRPLTVLNHALRRRIDQRHIVSGHLPRRQLHHDRGLFGASSSSVGGAAIGRIIIRRTPRRDQRTSEQQNTPTRSQTTQTDTSGLWNHERVVTRKVPRRLSGTLHRSQVTATAGPGGRGAAWAAVVGY